MYFYLYTTSFFRAPLDRKEEKGEKKKKGKKKENNLEKSPIKPFFQSEH